MSGGGTFPCLESPVEGIGIIIAKQEGGLIDFNRGLGEILVRHFLPSLEQELAKRGAFIGDAALQGARAHPKFLRYQKNVRAIARKQALKYPLYLVADPGPGAFLLQG